MWINTQVSMLLSMELMSTCCQISYHVPHLSFFLSPRFLLSRPYSVISWCTCVDVPYERFWYTWMFQQLLLLFWPFFIWSRLTLIILYSVLYKACSAPKESPVRLSKSDFFPYPNTVKICSFAENFICTCNCTKSWFLELRRYMLEGMRPHW